MLIESGVGPGDRVAVQLDNRPEFLYHSFGILRAGAIFVPVNVMYKDEEARHILTDSGARMLLSAMPQVAHSSAERPPVTVRPEDPSMIQYTSGATGTPKGAVVSHADRVTLFWGAQMPVVILERFKEMTGVGISEARGLSETSPILTFNTAGPVNKPGSAGPDCPGIDIAVLDDHDNKVPQGEVGEIYARGSVVLLGYWRNEEATREAMRGGWFHTGDLGSVVSGFNVYPIEVENVLLRHPLVRT